MTVTVGVTVTTTAGVEGVTLGVDEVTGVGVGVDEVTGVGVGVGVDEEVASTVV